MKGAVATIWIIVAALVLIGGGTYLYLHPEALGTSPSQEEGTETESTFSSSLTAEELLARGQTVTCTYEFESGNAVSTGTVYVANGMLRGDYETVSDGTSMKSHVILRDGMSHIWMDGMSEGFKSPITGAITTGGGNAAPDINSKLDYNCSAWTADESKFALPADVTFRTIDSIPSPS